MFKTVVCASTAVVATKVTKEAASDSVLYQMGDLQAKAKQMLEQGEQVDEEQLDNAVKSGMVLLHSWGLPQQFLDGIEKVAANKDLKATVLKKVHNAAQQGAKGVDQFDAKMNDLAHSETVEKAKDMFAPHGTIDAKKITQALLTKISNNADVADVAEEFNGLADKADSIRTKDVKKGLESFVHTVAAQVGAPQDLVDLADKHLVNVEVADQLNSSLHDAFDTVKDEVEEAKKNAQQDFAALASEIQSDAEDMLKI